MKSKRQNVFICIMLSLLIVVSGCFSIQQTSTEWNIVDDVIKVNDHYYKYHEELTNTYEIKDELGEIEFQTPKIGCKYEFTNFEASQLSVGTMLYSSKVNDESIFAKTKNGYKRYLFISDSMSDVITIE